MPQWTNVAGPADIYSQAYDSVHDLLYVGTLAAGVWVYDGTSWSDTGLGYEAMVLSMVFDDKNGLLYAGTGDYAGIGAYSPSPPAFGVWVYDGATWTYTGQVGDDARASVWSLAYDSVHDLLYAGTGSGSPDNGYAQGIWKLSAGTWTVVSSIINAANLLSAQDSSLEGAGVGGWAGAYGSCTVSNSTTWAAVGTHSLKLIPTEGAAPWAFIDVTAVTAAGENTISCQCKGIAGMWYRMATYDDVTGSQWGPLFLSDGNSQRITYLVTFGAGSTYRQIGFLAYSAHTAAQVVYADNFRIVAGIDTATLSVPYLAYDSTNNILYAGPETWLHDLAGVWACANPNTAPAWTRLAGPLVDQLYILTYDPVQEILYAGALADGAIMPDGVFRYDGTTWTYLGKSGSRVWSLAYNAIYQTLYVGMLDAGIWIFKNGNWTNISENLPAVCIETINTSDTKIFVGTVAEDAWIKENPPSVTPDPPPTPGPAQAVGIVTRKQPTPPTVEFWTPDMTFKYPNIDREIMGLTYSTIIYGGFATCAFGLYRKPWKYYPEFSLKNIVIVRSRHQIPWQGRISSPGVNTSDYKVSIEADGFIERLKTRLALANLDAAEKGSAWILAHMIADTDLGYLAGTIGTGDYAFPSGIDFTSTFYAEALEAINAGDNYRYGFFMPPQSHLYGNRFDFTPMSSTPDYYLDMADCDTDIKFTLEGVENYLRVKHDAGAGDVYFWWPAAGPDVASKALYDRRDGTLDIPGISTTAQAQQIAQIALDYRKRIRPASDVVVRKLTDSTGATVPTAEAQAGRVLHIRGLNPGEFTLLTAQSINELCTWPIVMAQPDIDAGTATLSPGGLANKLDKLLARAEMKAR